MVEEIGLRELRQHDYIWMYYACQDEEIRKWTTMGETFEYSDAFDYVANNKDYEEETWIITKKGLPIGAISKHSYLDDEDHGEVFNVGYWIMKSERGKGYGKRALEMFYDKLKPKKYCFQLEISPGNKASIRTALSAGFFVIGSRRGLYVYSK
jgi:RimJ/RimL family protein N-acetyltransferase